MNPADTTAGDRLLVAVCSRSESQIFGHLNDRYCEKQTFDSC